MSGHDIVVYGATGFTGRLVAEYLAAAGVAGWAMAGRSADKLAAVRDEIGAPADTPLIVADADDPATLDALVAQARVVISTVGPYQLHGSDLVAACAQTGTDYVDLCGEPGWMRRMIDAHDAAARTSGARIVFSCGFDSIPFDLGVWALQREAQARFGRPATRVKGRVMAMQGGFSGGTAASLKATLAAVAKEPSLGRLLIDPFALAPGFVGPAQPKGLLPHIDDAIGKWVAPFIMAPINTKNVHRTNFLLGHPYGRDFVYDEMLVTGLGDMGRAAAEALARANPLAGDKGPKPGEGPSRDERENGFYEILFIGEVAGAGEVRLTVKGDRDPGYGSTSRMIAESALCLIADVPGAAGGITLPGAIMAAPLIERLEARAGITLRAE